MKILFGISGSFCNHHLVLNEIKKIAISNDVQVIVSENVYTLDSRFHDAKSFIEELERISKHSVWHTILEAEKVGPMNHYDIYIIAPATSNVLSKLNHAIYDHPLTLAAKAMLRNNKNIVLAIASNDFLGIGSKNLFSLLNYKHIYIVPFYQDNPYTKPNSLVSEFSLIEDTMEYALLNKQIQPILLQRGIE